MLSHLVFKRIISIFVLALLTANSSNAQRSDSDNPYIGGGIAILDLVAEDPREYVSMQRQNSEAFEELGADLAGVCTAVSGNDLAGEMQVYAVFPSSAFNMWDIMLTSNQIRNIQNEFNSSRTLLGNQTER